MHKQIVLITIILFAIQLIASCRYNPYGTEVNNLRTSQKQYSSYRTLADQARAAERQRQANFLSSFNQAIACRDVASAQLALAQFNDIVHTNRRDRELAGGQGCQCIPMGTTCSSGTCLCSEICPADERILDARAHQVAPSRENSFPFENDKGYNDGIFANNPLTNGYCAGFVEQRRNFALLADFRPDLVTIPAMEIPSQTWIDYTRTQIRRMVIGENPTFVGLQSLDELSRPENAELKTFMMTLLGWREWPTPIPSRIQSSTNPMTHDRMYVSPVFIHPNSRSFAGQTAIDPQTNARIPEQGTDAYHEYIKSKIRTIMQGQAAAIPGYANLLSLADNPTYSELMGNEIARSHQETNAEELAWNYTLIGRDGREDETRRISKAWFRARMNSDEYTRVWNDLTQNLAPFPATYPANAEGRSWNNDGPVSTVTISVRARATNPRTNQTETVYHAMEAYSYKTTPTGDKIICVADPNLTPLINNNCNNHITIPTNGNPIYTGEPTWDVLQFDMSIAATARLGHAITQNINYCRQINAGKFAANDCEGTR